MNTKHCLPFHTYSRDAKSQQIPLDSAKLATTNALARSLLQEIADMATTTRFEFFALLPQQSPQEVEEAKALLAASQLEFDSQIEVMALCRAEGRVVACAGLDHNVIKCVAVAQDFRGESLSLRLGSEIVALAAERGHFHLFLYSPPHNRDLFRGWGFYPLVEVPGLVLLMENSPIAITTYCNLLRRQKKPGNRIGCCVLNANPFTLGHRFLVERAASDCDWVHVFVVGKTHRRSLIRTDSPWSLQA